MKYQKIVNLLDNTPNPPSKFKTKKCVKINDESQGTYNKDNQIKLKSSMLRSSLRDYSDIYIYIYIYIYILAKRNTNMANTAAQDQPNNGASKKFTFKNCAPFTKCISRKKQYTSR